MGRAFGIRKSKRVSHNPTHITLNEDDHHLIGFWATDCAE